MCNRFFLPLKYSHKPEEQRRVVEVIAAELASAAVEFMMHILCYLIAVCESVDAQVIREVIQKARPEEEEAMMSLFAQEIIAKGKFELVAWKASR